ncbi:MAG: aspartate/glutamate racemase family protein [Deltaproteobacteria bacterium]|nr:aspartate/glutamate racemase family protein [Deltaproteobacteria bacterium]
MKLVGMIHSTRLVIESVHKAIALRCPEIDFFHVMDEGILRKLTAAGRITPEIIQWLAEMVLSAERAGADMAVVSCSSLSPCVNAVQEQVDIPVIKIDAPMMEHALTHAERIGLLMTNPTTEAPSKVLFREVSDRLGRSATLIPRLCPQAFAKLNQGDVRGHDMEVIRTVEELLKEADVVMLAQISIARIKDHLDDALKSRVFSSLDFIAPEIRRVLALQPKG